MSVQVYSSRGSLILTRPHTARVYSAGAYDYDGTDPIYHIDVQAIASADPEDATTLCLQITDLPTLRAIVAAMVEGLAKVEAAEALRTAAPALAGVR